MEKILYEGQIFKDLKRKSESFENYEFINCVFIDCIFEECKLLKCTFNGCKFEKCRVISLKAESSNLKNAELTNCNLIGIHWGDLLPTGRFADPIKKMQNCLLKYNTFTGMNLTKFNFSNSEVIDSLFSECILTESNFKRGRLERTEFFKCDLNKADFREASGYQIDIMSNKLKGARFSFPEVVNLLNSLSIKID